MKLFLILLLSLFAFEANAANRFAVCTAACTWDNSSTAMWSTTTGGTTGASVPTTTDDVIFDAATCVGGVTCTTTINTNITVISITMSVCTASTSGCILDFSANNNNVTLSSSTSAFVNSGTGTRTINMGNGIWTLSGTGSAVNLWNMNTTTNLTFNANSSTIVFSGAGTGVVQFLGGGKTYNILTINANSNRGGLSIQGSNTFSTININAPNTIVVTSSTTTTITNAFNFVGTSSNPIGIFTSSATTAATISTSSGTPTLTWGAVRGITFSGGATFTATNSFDLGLNTGITITAPSTSGGGKIIGG